ncbi:hypothetical protein HanHA300_Chr03g0097671 [Helianthus annuus]|nr:hypothetical protein HanHA300_Chr03g0097671 [Helianthus annuus]KAJ0608515.1 hypothetical protein HanHA89_Chr03g0109371 [Helianthus annuus]KAJ0768580.1 hypothetical protein HanLR1_Chr03g0102751 [Helianthus annuus]KAJ0774325.1 hypothetical protein HanOQP8_Chr03g0110231 [Helianthus annuus]
MRIFGGNTNEHGKIIVLILLILIHRSGKLTSQIAMKSMEETLDKSDKARKLAKCNKIPHRCGRSGYRALRQKMDNIWPPMGEAKDPLKEMNDKHCQLLVASRIRKDPQTGTYDTEKYKKIGELVNAKKNMILYGTYDKGPEDPITKVFRREHGG